jgi:hypothetical protein
MPQAANSLTDFVARWRESGAAERANFQPFLSELCDVLGVERPRPAQADDGQNAYVFERAVTFHNPDGTTSGGRIDLYKRGCFVLEAKQGSDPSRAESPLFEGAPDAAPRGRARRGTAVRGTRGWDVAMRKALGQAEQYVRALPASEGNPPFLVVVDVGHSFELYSDFSRAGKTYVPFPDARTHRVLLEDLAREEVRERLRLLWEDPAALDPSRRSARVTRDVAGQLAALARSLEGAGYSPERVASFLMRAIFTMFAEDVRLIPAGSFTGALENIKRAGVEIFSDEVGSLWETMNTGGYTSVLKTKVIQFNGGLFEECEALPLDESQLDLLIAASRADWKDVEPAIFGTLLERALNPRERHRLGAHYTPRAYVERLVMPAVVEPLRQEWADVLVAAAKLDADGRAADAAEEVKAFHRRLCRVRVLDPACGSGNFLYVTLEHLKRLEGEVLDALHGFGESQGVLEDTGLTVDPHQLLGIEVNPRAAAITDLVLWIGYLQWHFRTRGEVLPPAPVIRKFHNIECRDAVLAYDGVEEVRDEGGEPLTRWDGRTYKRHPVTGEDVPDETARVPLLRYLNPRKAAWPEADFIVGNPPFVGTRKMRLSLGDGYVNALAEAIPEVPRNADYVMYWWDNAAEVVRQGNAARFGFITTNSITHAMNRAAIRRHLSAPNMLSILFAIPDHPWVDTVLGANVRVAMTVGSAGQNEGVRLIVNKEIPNEESSDVEFDAPQIGSITEDLQLNISPASTVSLKANSEMAHLGAKFYGDGFIVTPNEAAALSASQDGQTIARPFISGRDLTGTPRGLLVLDCTGLSEDDLQRKFPASYQRLLDRVKPVREHNPRATKRERWWIFGENQPGMRRSVEGLFRYIATVETAKHRAFVFINNPILAEGKLVVIASDDAYILAVLSSGIHITWALAAGSTLEDRPVYNKTRCFDPFPFPICTEEQKERIRKLGEDLDAHRKRQQAQHPGLTITEMYNVLEKLRRDEPLNERERVTHADGLVSVLRQIHDELDAAVFDAYGWPASLTDEEVLERLVRLNAERAAEERAGTVRWLRPDFQKPAEGVAAAFGEEFKAVAPAAAAREKQPWPKSLPEQARAVRQALASGRGVVTPRQLAQTFRHARVERIEELLRTLVSLGQAREVGEGRYTS